MSLGNIVNVSDGLSLVKVSRHKFLLPTANTEGFSDVISLSNVTDGHSVGNFGNFSSSSFPTAFSVGNVLFTDDHVVHR